MSQIKQLIRLYQAGTGKKTIARDLGLSKNTVKAYISKLQSLKVDLGELLSLDDPVLETRFHAGNPAYKDTRYEQLKPLLGDFIKELNKTGVTRHLLWEEYKELVPHSYSYSQFCYHLWQYTLASHPSMVLAHKPGEKLYIDFAGKKLSYTDPETGEVIYCEVFVACLPYSDYGFAMAVPSQRIEDFIYALSCCLHDLGGGPQVLVPDNLKSAIVKASHYEPDVNRALEDFANHYQCTVIPARAGKPKDKALVENQVKLIYNRVYARLRKRQFFSLGTLNEAIAQMVRLHNQTRMQQKPYSREECFVADEKHLLKALPEQAYEIKYYRELKVAKNNHVFLAQDKHYYSVPYQYTGMKVKVIYTRSLVRIYAKGNQVALHKRNYRPGTYSTDPSHLCSQHRHYLERSPDYYKNKARAYDACLGKLFEQIFTQDKYPEQLYKSCDGLLQLARNTSKEQLRQACEVALAYQNYSYTFMRNLLTNKVTLPTRQQPPKPLPQHGNKRGKSYFQTILNLF
ncbi:MAG: IS21 family transposase [Bacteroidales bacterium]|nr:IS21 family transposase [Bacteroidales bacterium]